MTVMTSIADVAVVMITNITADFSSQVRISQNFPLEKFVRSIPDISLRKHYCLCTAIQPIIASNSY